MKINKLKNIWIPIFCLVVALWSETQCMEEKHHDNDYKIQESEASCSHWGLSHWGSGIKEYIFDRCLLGGNGFNEVDPDRQYILRHAYDSNEDYKIYSTSDCCCVGTWGYMECGDELTNCLPNGIIMGTLCCPLATCIHTLCCLPCAFCLCTPPITPAYTDIQTPSAAYLKEKKMQQEMRLKEQESQALQEEYEKLKAQVKQMSPEELAEMNRKWEYNNSPEGQAEQQRALDASVNRLMAHQFYNNTLNPYRR